MTCQLQVKLAGGLIDIARAMRVLKRYRIGQSQLSIVREGSVEVATVRGTLYDPRGSTGLTAALARIPAVLEAVVSHEDQSVAAFYCAGWGGSSPRRGGGERGA